MVFLNYKKHQNFFYKYFGINVDIKLQIEKLLVLKLQKIFYKLYKVYICYFVNIFHQIKKIVLIMVIKMQE